MRFGFIEGCDCFCFVVLWFGLRFALFVSVLAGNYLGSEGAGRLAEPLGKLTALRELYLSSTV